MGALFDSPDYEEETGCRDYKGDSGNADSGL